MAKPQTPKRPSDMNQLAKRIVDLSTGRADEDTSERSPTSERAAKGGKARAEALTARKRKMIARKAAKKRWEKDKGD